MPDKRSIILDSVRKLLALDLSDEKRIKNLRDVGISESEARAILAEAKGEQKEKKEEVVLPESEEDVIKALEKGLEETEEEAEEV